MLIRKPANLISQREKNYLHYLHSSQDIIDITTSQSIEIYLISTIEQCFNPFASNSANLPHKDPSSLNQFGKDQQLRYWFVALNNCWNYIIDKYFEPSL